VVVSPGSTKSQAALTVAACAHHVHLIAPEDGQGSLWRTGPQLSAEPVEEILAARCTSPWSFKTRGSLCPQPWPEVIGRLQLDLAMVEESWEGLCLCSRFYDRSSLGQLRREGLSRCRIQSQPAPLWGVERCLAEIQPGPGGARERGNIKPPSIPGRTSTKIIGISFRLAF